MSCRDSCSATVYKGVVALRKSRAALTVHNVVWPHTHFKFKCIALSHTNELLAGTRLTLTKVDVGG